MTKHLRTDQNIKGYLGLNKWWPITRACCFIHAPVDEALRSFNDWMSPLVAKNNGALQVHEIKGSFDTAFEALLPLRSWPNKRLFLPTANNEWTAIFDNYSQGTEPHSLTTVMNRRYGHDAIEAIDIPHTLSKDKMRGNYGCVSFVYYSGNEQQRSIRLVHEHRGWEFGTYGDPLAFEHLAVFNRPRKTDRFNHEELLKYLLAMGIDVSHEPFYMPEGRAFIVESIGEVFDVEIKNISLDEARERG